MREFESAGSPSVIVFAVLASNRKQRSGASMEDVNSAVADRQLRPTWDRRRFFEGKLRKPAGRESAAERDTAEDDSRYN